MNTLDFLNAFRPDGTHLLTSIPQNGGQTITAPFCDDDDEMMSWIGTQQGQQRNVYFSVNPVIRAVAKKAGRDNIAAMEYLHVDLDLPAGTTPETLEAERAKLLAQLTTDLPDGVPTPTFVVDSGGGYWGFWRLTDPFQINGDETLFEEAKRYNQQLELLFGADACHNVDRIARLPGLMNYPNKKKVAMRGEDPLPTAVVQYNPDAVYSIRDFRQAPKLQGADRVEGVEISGNIEYADDVDARFPELSERVKTVIVQGTDPDDPAKFTGRSEWLFWVVCEMVRKNYSDEDIYMAITNSSWGISDSVLDKGGRRDSYAKRQIQRARELAIDPQLAKMNDQYAVIQNFGGKCLVMESRPDASGGPDELVFQDFTNFHNSHCNRKVSVQYVNAKGDLVSKDIPLGKWWTEHENRRQYEQIIFDPSGDRPGAFNRWRGFACAPIKGDIPVLLEHIRKNICRNDEELYQYLMGWMANAVQRPGEPGHTAIVLKGGRGAGKGQFVEKFGRLFGHHFKSVTDRKHLVGNFNAHLQDCVVLFADEAFAVNDKQAESTLKVLVTESSIMSERKGVDATTSANYLHILMASNEDWVVPAGPDERRYLVLEVGDENKQDHGFFKRLNEEYDNGGKEALLYMLLNWDLTDFNVRQAPATESMLEQKLMSLSPTARFWYSRLEEGCFGGDTAWSGEVPKPLVVELLQEELGRLGRSVLDLEDKLKKMYLPLAKADGYDNFKFQGRIPYLDRHDRPHNNPTMYFLPDLDTARELFADRYLGGPVSWPKPPSIATEEEAF